MKKIFKFLMNQEFKAKVCLVVFSAMLVMQLLTLLAVSEKPAPQIVVFDKNTILLPTSTEFKDATTFHIGIARLALEKLLHRNPGGVDDPDFLELLFLPDAYEKAMDDVEYWSQRFRKFGFHQKVNIAEIKIVRASDNSIRAIARGQLIRLGNFDQKRLDEVDDFKASITMYLNTNVMTNNYYPVVVHDFDIETQPVLSR